MGPNELLLDDKTVTWEQRLYGNECVICGGPTHAPRFDKLPPVIRKDGNAVERRWDTPFAVCSDPACVMSEGVIEPAAIVGALCSRFYDAPGEVYKITRGNEVTFMASGWPRGDGSPVGRLDLYIELFNSAVIKWSPDNSMMFADETHQYRSIPEALTAMTRFVPDDGRGDPGRYFFRQTGEENGQHSK